MATPLKLSMLIEGDATSAKKAAAEAKAAVENFGSAARATAAAANDVGKGAAGGMALAKHEVSNLSAQIADLGVQISGGGSPLMAMIQQGPQIAEVLGGRGLTGIIAGVGQGIASLVNPVTLTLAAITGAGYAASWAFEMTRKEVLDTDEVLKEHEANIKRLKEAWGEPLEGIKTYQSAAAAEFRVRAGQIGTRAALQQDAEQALTDFFRKDEGWLSSGGVEGIGPFLGAVNNLRQSISDGTPKMREFQNAIVSIADTNPANLALQKTADELLKLSERAAQIEDAVKSDDAALNGIKRSKASETQWARPSLGGIVGADTVEQRRRDQSEAERLSEILQGSGEKPNGIERLDMEAEARERAGRAADREADRQEKRSASFIRSQEDRIELLTAERSAIGFSAQAREALAMCLRHEPRPNGLGIL